MKNIKLKIGNMRKEEDFILYPYDGGDNIMIQSDKRFCIINLKTGLGKMNKTGCNYPNTMKVIQNPMQCELPKNIKIEIQKYLWENKGMSGDVCGVLKYENKELFSIY